MNALLRLYPQAWRDRYGLGVRLSRGTVVHATVTSGGAA